MANTNPTAATVNLPLNRLHPSPDNVRRSGGEEGMRELKASILAHGLLQNLNVRREVGPRGGPTGRYFVVAGGRRLAALCSLAKAGKIGRTARISCRIVEDAEATEASLAENVVRVAMHPADQFEAFSRLAQEGRSAERIAERFGVTTLTVRQRLKLAAVSPALLDRYREGRMGLDTLTAFAVTDDHAAQERAWHQVEYQGAHPHAVRRLLTEGRVPADDRRVAFVGLAAYEAAGGGIETDLFAEDGAAWLTNPALLDRLTMEKVATEAERLRLAEGWKWAEAHMSFPHDLAWRLARARPEALPLSAEDEARRNALAEEHDELADALNGGDEDEAMQARYDAVAAELESLEAREQRFLPKDLARTGIIIALDGVGALRVERGFVRAEDVPVAEPANDDAEEEAEEQDAKPAPLPSALHAELLAQRTAALRASLARQPDLALRALTHALASKAFHGESYGSSIAVTTHGADLRQACPGIHHTRAGERLADDRAAWTERLPKDRDDLWTWIAAQDTATVMALLAYCVATAADAGHAEWGGGQPGSHAALASAAGLDMRAWWQADRESYLGRVPKAAILAAVRDGAGDDAARRIGGAKKDAMAEAAVAMLDGKRWLPAILRSPTSQVAVVILDEAVPVRMAAE
jgi:ParB family transcriptional regulator, chromosome partitioning protein